MELKSLFFTQKSMATTVKGPNSIKVAYWIKNILGVEAFRSASITINLLFRFLGQCSIIIADHSKILYIWEFYICRNFKNVSRQETPGGLKELKSVASNSKPYGWVYLKTGANSNPLWTWHCYIATLTLPSCFIFESVTVTRMTNWKENLTKIDN